MKQIIFLMIIVALFFGCHESNSVEPILDYDVQQNQWEGKLDKKKKLILVYLSCEYQFSPDPADQQCGGLMNGTSLTYIKDEPNRDGISQRYIKRAQIYSPSKMVIKGKTFNTYHVYTLNRREKITLGGKVLGGKTWGTFKIIENKGPIPKKEAYFVVLFKGEFAGDILHNTTKIKLKGVGQKMYRNCRFQAIEKQNCTSSDGKLHCWASAITGRISIPIITEE